MDHHQALSKAKIHLMSKPDSTFFTTLCFSLRHVFTEDFPTLATDGKRILINPKFFMQMDREEQVSALLHETLHVAYLHLNRRGDRDPTKWNFAGDYLINGHLNSRGFKIGQGWLLDSQYDGMSTDEIYDRLPDRPSMQLPMQDLLPPAEGSDAAKALDAEVKSILVRAAMQSKMAGDKPGTIPGDIQIFLDNLLNPKLPWQRILQKFFHAFAKNDYSFKRPNRRFLPKYYLPSLYSSSLCDLTIAVDTSGSVSDEEFRQFVSETAQILRMMKPETIHLIQFDTELKSVERVRSVTELMRVRFSGRGGTEIGPAMDWARAHKPQAMLVFTDGGFYFRGGEDPGVPVIWVIHNNERFEPQFGKAVHYEI